MTTAMIPTTTVPEDAADVVLQLPTVVPVAADNVVPGGQPPVAAVGHRRRPPPATIADAANAAAPHAVVCVDEGRWPAGAGERLVAAAASGEGRTMWSGSGYVV